MWPFSKGSSSHRSSRSPARSSYSHRSGTSYYKRSPRRNLIQRLLHKLKHMFREMYYYARRHPVKVFFLIIMPLITSGALATVAKVAGISLPSFLMGKHAAAAAAGGSGYYGSRGYENEGGLAEGVGNLVQGMSGGGLGSVMSLAKNFL